MSPFFWLFNLVLAATFDWLFVWSLTQSNNPCFWRLVGHNPLNSHLAEAGSHEKDWCVNVMHLAHPAGQVNTLCKSGGINVTHVWMFPCRCPRSLLMYKPNCRIKMLQYTRCWFKWHHVIAISHNSYWVHKRLYMPSYSLRSVNWTSMVPNNAWHNHWSLFGSPCTCLPVCLSTLKILTTHITVVFVSDNTAAFFFCKNPTGIQLWGSTFNKNYRKDWCIITS